MGSAGAQPYAAAAPQLERSTSKVTAADTISKPVSDGAWETTVDFMDDDQARAPRPTPRRLLARDVFRRAPQVIVILYEESADASGGAAARKIYKAAAQEYHGARFSPRFSPSAVLFGGAGCEAVICLAMLGVCCRGWGLDDLRGARQGQVPDGGRRSHQVPKCLRSAGWRGPPPRALTLRSHHPLSRNKIKISRLA
jgi:hypothetical protein